MSNPREAERDVRAALTIGRALWELAYEARASASEAGPYPGAIEVQWGAASRFWAGLRDVGRPLIAKVRERLLQRGWWRETEPGRLVHVHPSTLRLGRLVEELVRPDVAAADADYFLWRALRMDLERAIRTQNQQHSGEQQRLHQDMTRALRTVAEALRVQMAEHAGRGELLNTSDGWVARPLLEALSRALVGDGWQRAGALEFSRVFLECCRALPHIDHPYRAPLLWVEPEWCDIDRLSSYLHGLRTRIPSFDELFGGGGLLLTERRAATSSGGPLGRVILIRGRFGTGKTSLALAIGVEVARKGGIGCVLPLEQPPEECVQYLNALGMLSSNERVEIQPIRAADSAASSSKDARGLEILKPEGDSLVGMIEQIAKLAARPGAVTPALYIIDPVNSALSPEDPESLRGILVHHLNRIRECGANLLLTAEFDQNAPGRVDFLANIADTVIELKIQRDHGYAQRYVEVQKSRLQRELRGMHPMAIEADVGVSIAVSSAAVMARTRARASATGAFTCGFGWEPLDGALGPGAFFQGDTLLLRGEEGTLKTHLGLMFLTHSDWQERRPDRISSDTYAGLKPTSLFIAVRDQSAVARVIDAPFLQAYRLDDRRKRKKQREDIWTLPLPSGFVSPGWILRLLDETFQRANSQGRFIDRVMVSNLTHWETSCPFVESDPIFADTLNDYFRSRQATVLYVSGEERAQSGLRKSLLDDANVIIELERVEYHGRTRVMLHPIKTREMAHSPELRELRMEDGVLHLRPSLLMPGRNGARAFPVPIDLLLFAETDTQEEYNKEVAKRIRTRIQTSSKVNEDREALIGLARSNSVMIIQEPDSVQIVQLDEFQLPALRERSDGPGRPILHAFSQDVRSAEEWTDFDSQLQLSIRSTKDASRILALPYYQNIGLLCVSTRGPDLKTESWEQLASDSAEWDRSHPDSGELFFSLTKHSSEDYNSLFLEIALSLHSESERSSCLPKDAIAELASWMRDDHKAYRACQAFRLLCRREFVERQRMRFGSAPGEGAASSTDRPSPLPQCPPALVRRYWFTTLRQAATASDVDWTHTELRALPGSVAVAGEWYLGIGARSVAREIGVGIIQEITSPGAELERARRGVGLPTRRSSFERNGGGVWLPPIPRSNDLHLGNMLRGAFRRSAMRGYAAAAPFLSEHLKRMLFEGADGQPLPDAQLAAIIDDLDDALRAEFGGSRRSTA